MLPQLICRFSMWSWFTIAWGSIWRITCHRQTIEHFASFPAWKFYLSKTNTIRRRLRVGQLKAWAYMSFLHAFHKNSSHVSIRQSDFRLWNSCPHWRGSYRLNLGLTIDPLARDLSCLDIAVVLSPIGTAIWGGKRFWLLNAWKRFVLRASCLPTSSGTTLDASTV